MTWQTVASTADIQEGQPVIVRVEGKEIGILVAGGRYFAVLNFCPHGGAPICLGRTEGCVTADPATGTQSYDHRRVVLRCPWHHWEFDLDSGNALVPIRQRLRTYPTRVEGDQIQIALGT